MSKKSNFHPCLLTGYIYEQETHHKTVPFSQEVDTFMKKHGWQLIKGCG